MTVDELIAALQQLPPDVRHRPVMTIGEYWLQEIDGVEPQRSEDGSMFIDHVAREIVLLRKSEP